MLSTVVNHIIFFGGTIALLLALVQLLQVFRHSKHLWLCLFYSCLAFIVLQQYYYGIIGTENLELGEWPGQFVKFVAGPAIYLYFRKLLYRDVPFGPLQALHFLPALLSVFLEAYLSLSESPSSGFHAFLAATNINYYYNVFGIALVIFYHALILLREDFLSIFRRKVSDRVLWVALVFLLMEGAIITLMIIAIIARRLELARLSGCLIALPLLFIFLVGYLSPESIHMFVSVVKKNIFERSLIKGLDMTMLRNRLRDLMEEEKIFCDEDLSLKRLADLLSISPHQLSEFLNKHLNSNFNYYINRLRIEEAVVLMKSQPERSVTSICYSVGFNSRSVFYDAFTKFTGMSPARYRKNLEL